MYKDILLPVDITDKHSWKSALNIVIEYVSAFNSNLHILYVVSESGMSIVAQYFPKSSVQEVLDKANSDLHDFVNKNIPKNLIESHVQHIIGKGSVYDCIIDTSSKINADLIVMPAHRPELKDYLLGPNSAKVVRHSNISVLVVRDSK